MAIYLNKKKVYTRLQDEKQVLYNYINKYSFRQNLFKAVGNWQK